MSKQTDARAVRSHLVNGHKVQSFALGGLQLDQLNKLHDELHATSKIDKYHRTEGL